ncbi:MAG TPA: zf-HC2 domain-containing protein [Terriglobales bacterium]|jgi:hypothetical protein|nr:zf-HC2 domain-containing protein [Terriglobales bacterium]
MDHSEAVTKKLTESYLLGELTPDEREAYEEHYFGCPECAQDVKTGAMLVANVKEVLREERSLSTTADPVRERAGWPFFAWLQPAYAMAALAVLVCVLAFQNLVTIPELKDEAKTNVPQALASYSFIPQGSRGANALVVRPEPNRPFGLYVDIPESRDFSSYLCTIQTEAGVVDLSVPVSAELAKENVQIFVPAGRLQPGNYLLVIRGSRSTGNPSEAGVEVARYPFSLEYKNEGTTKP